MRDILKHTPGFRSGTKYKKIIAIIYYLLVLLMFTEGFGIGLFYLAAPFVVFLFIDLIRHKKKSISLKRATVSFAVSLVLMFVGMGFSSSDVESTDTSQKESQHAAIDDEISKADNTNIIETPKEDVENKEPDETIEKQLFTNANKNEKDIQKVTESDDTQSQTSESNKEPVKTDGRLEVHFIDVGHADSALIKAANGQTMLIDAGNNSDGDFVTSYLKKTGVSKIDVLIGTHPHADHIGGLDDVINNFDIGKIYMPKISHTTKTFEDVLLAIQSKGLKVSTFKPSQTFSLGDVKFTILGPVKSYDDLNNNSIVLKMTYGSTSFIFTGDAESIAETDIINRGYNLSADVLKVGHHGSNTSTSNSFLQAVSPKYAVISVGSGNKYGHPTQDTLVKLAETNTKVYRTDESGTIIAKSDGQRITFDKKASVIKNEESPSKSPKATEVAKVTEAAKATEATKVTETPTAEPTKEETQKAVETPNTDNAEEVYITNTGAKYHRGSCSSLKKSKIATSLEKAKSDGYEPCKRCH